MENDSKTVVEQIAATEVVEEWRVTGDPGKGYPPYLFTFRSNDERWPGSEAGGKAREFVQRMDDWADGPHLHHRTVMYSAWVAR